MREQFNRPTDHYSDILTVPNVITMLRILLVPVFIVFFLKDQFVWAMVAFGIAGISDGLDGYLARKLDCRTRLGQALDPIADKLMMLSGYLVMAIPSQANFPIPWWLTVAVIGRDVTIVSVAALIAHFTGFKDFKPSLPGKVSTVGQIVLIVVFLLAQVAVVIRPVLPAIVWLVLGMTAFSGLHYIWFVSAEVREFRRNRNVPSPKGS